MAAEKLYQVSSPVPQSLYPTLATVLLAAGLASTGGFFLYEVSKTRHGKQLKQELALALIASVCLGLGTLFLLLWTGVYV
mmetsp:Transcript_12013/g.29367  ORF Transcript_12013/g.29367 Transcript_12013/m.29367 type:complete len:80 (+) Transcript_12013:38-277(+)